MALLELEPIEALQWGTVGGFFMDVIPQEVCLFLSTAEGKTFGYGYGPGASMIFGSEQGDVKLEIGQWLVRLSDGSVVVEDERPEGAELFDTQKRLVEMGV